MNCFELNNTETILVSEAEMKNIFYKILLKQGFNEQKALTCAEIFTESSIDGVYSHGVNRFPRFIEDVQKKYVDISADPVLKRNFNGLEQWDGNLGAGPLNALHATERAMQLAQQYGIGCVALANTNHWMRAGSYGWKAAKGGFVFIGWTNTIANMPTWNAVDARLGNNPLVIALPFHDEAIVLDMAASQFSYGALEQAAIRQETLPVDGGYNSKGELTKDPAAIFESKRVLPVGYWKGAGLSLLLDLLASILSSGLSVHEISKREREYGLSQIFIAIDTSKLMNHSTIKKTVDSIIDDYRRSIPINESKKVLYPGERVLATRKKNVQDGIPVLKNIWAKILSLERET
ncbi:MAG TPA: 3-dehydro-L-gulonate 2-dehydrogenase [Chitinophagaceae bacterium]|jgi:3-dehydro-L-gulonate 2-dehydrogenase|nr:3-dehydro-L-gulonate 2-dehydrogenase [Chitinophagaceae bacterium]